MSSMQEEMKTMLSCGLLSHNQKLFKRGCLEAGRNL